jgi:hypothetical protein
MAQVRQSQFILRVSNHFVKFSRSKLKLSRTDGRMAYYYNNNGIQQKYRNIQQTNQIEYHQL